MFKKVTLLLAFTALYISSVFSQTQLTVPKVFYVGDEVQLQVSFDSPVDLFVLPGIKKDSSNVVYLDVNMKDFDSVRKDVSFKSAVLTRNGISYTVTINFIPWKTGRIKFPHIDLIDICRGSEYCAMHPEVYNFEDFPLDFDSIKVGSISSELKVSSLREPFGPVTIPGTTYVVWAVLIGMLFIMILVAVFLVKLPKVIRKIHHLHKKLSFRKNTLLTRIRFLILLYKRKITDVDFAASWQKIMRQYFTKRYRVSFFSVTSSRMSEAVLGHIADSSNEKYIIASVKVRDFFLRTDYIRFASGSIDSRLFPAEEHEACFAPGETKNIIRESVQLIKIFEERGERKHDSV